MNATLTTISLRLMAALGVLTLTQCTWPEPRYQARYGGPPTPTACYRDPLFGDPFFGYTVLKCASSSPLWAHLHEVEARECYPCRDVWVEAPAVQTVVVTQRSGK